ncbi:hypothetical protein K1T71_000657 [Dendrolimus kikuchii]|uniref:Uncharacterized protein n=1 Tax=Dendrolimus kikuchii TaxID=765133 RepID=A0ACC1DJT7_9NEOP|nr:hypothetical protein K1T71_000657 [Dendrolimus kikuchii]
MSSFLCFICHSTVNMDTNEITREKYKELVGMHLNQDSHLCHVCCHILNKFWLFRSVCMKRSMEYPVLFSDDIDNTDHYDFNYHTDNKGDNELEKQNNVNTFDYVDNFFDEEPINDIKEGRINKDNNDINNSNYNENNSNYDENNSNCKINNYLTISKNDEINNCNDDINNSCNIHPDINSANSNNVCMDNTIDNIVYDEDDASISVIEVDTINTQNTNDKEKRIKKKKKSKKSKRDFEKIVLSLDEQKAELERSRKEKKYIEAEFKCYNCAQGFLFKDTYQTHMMRHEESNGEYRCTTCTLRFVSPAVFRAHTSLHTDRYKCVRCGLMLRLRHCKAHAVQCGGKSVEEVVTCHLCGNVFKDSSGLSQHLCRFHKLRAKNRTYSCTVCGKIYNNQAAVRTHMIKHIQRQFHCEQCPSTFSSPYMLNQHKKKHETTYHEQHYCTTCKIGYSTRKSLLAHKRNALVHQRTVFECKICARLCPNRLALSTHMQRVHASCKQYACNVCGKRYASNASLRRHEGTHMPSKETRLHMCHMCPRTFKSKSKLNRHLREVCEKDKLEEELSIYYTQHQAI